MEVTMRIKVVEIGADDVQQIVSIDVDGEAIHEEKIQTFIGDESCFPISLEAQF